MRVAKKTPLRAKLIAVDQWAAKRKIVVRKFPMTIGRSPEVGICLDDRWASRQHCELDEIGGTLVVRDLDSTHGTFVNGMEVTESRLMPGDKLTIGLSSFLAQYTPRETGVLTQDADEPAAEFTLNRPR